MSKQIKKVVLAYSGGLDTSVILRWITGGVRRRGHRLHRRRRARARRSRRPREKALATGAIEAITEDLREEFVRDFVYPAIRANAIYEGYYLLGTSLARPIIGKGLVEVAEQTGADAIAHGATGQGQRPGPLRARGLSPSSPTSRSSHRGGSGICGGGPIASPTPQTHDIPIPVTPEKPYSMDANLLHISYEGGVLEDPWTAPPADMFQMTVNPEEAPDEPEWVTIGFHEGTPVSVDGVELGPVDLLTHAQRARRPPRCRPRRHRREPLRRDEEPRRLRDARVARSSTTPIGPSSRSRSIARSPTCATNSCPRYAEMVYNGFWFSPEREALQAFMDDVQKRVNGEARLKLYKGQAIVEGRRSDSHSLYDEATATFEADDVYDQGDATGFIRLQSLRLRTFAERRIGEGE